MKSEKILLVTAGLLVASGCSERNPAYIQGKADASVPKDATLLSDKPVASDSGPSTPDTGPRESGLRADTRVDARDAGFDGPSAAVDGFESLDVAEVGALREVGEEGDLRSSGDGPSLALDASPDARGPEDRVQDVEFAPDGPEGDAPDGSVPSLDGTAVDTSEQDVAIDLPEGTDGAEGDATDDGLAIFDGEAADTTPDEESVASPSWVAPP